MKSGEESKIFGILIVITNYATTMYMYIYTRAFAESRLPLSFNLPSFQEAEAG